MNRISALLRPLLLACAAALSACVTSPYYTQPSGSVYYVQEPWFYGNSYRDCYDLWYGCSRPYHGHSYSRGYRRPPVHHHHPSPEPPPDDKPVYAPKPPRLIRLDEERRTPGRVLAPAPAAKPPPRKPASAAPVHVAPKPTRAAPVRPQPQTQPERPRPRLITGSRPSVESPAAKPPPAKRPRLLRER